MSLCSLLALVKFDNVGLLLSKMASLLIPSAALKWEGDQLDPLLPSSLTSCLTLSRLPHWLSVS